MGPYGVICFCFYVYKINKEREREQTKDWETNEILHEWEVALCFYLRFFKWVMKRKAVYSWGGIVLLQVIVKTENYLMYIYPVYGIETFMRVRSIYDTYIDKNSLISLRRKYPNHLLSLLFHASKLSYKAWHFDCYPFFLS